MADLDLLFENVPPPGTKRVAVIIGRFNPPTKGHYELIQKVREYTRTHTKLGLDAVPVVVVIGNDKKKKIGEELLRNPLTVQERISFMQGSGHANGVKFISAINAFEALTKCRQEGLEPIAVAAGSDRIQDYIKILDQYFKDANDKKIKHHAISLPRDEGAVETKSTIKADNIDDTLASIKAGEELTTDVVSASLARRAAELGYFEEFAKIVGLEKNTKLAKLLFDKVKKALDSGNQGEQIKEWMQVDGLTSMSRNEGKTVLRYFWNSIYEKLLSFFEKYNRHIDVKFDQSDSSHEINVTFNESGNEEFWFIATFWFNPSSNDVSVSLGSAGEWKDSFDFLDDLADDETFKETLARHREAKFDIHDVITDFYNLISANDLIDGFDSRWQFSNGSYPFGRGHFTPERSTLIKILGEPQ